MDKLKNMKKTTKNNIITYALVIAAFVIMQSLINAGSISSLLEGLMVPLCIYIIMAVSLNLVVRRTWRIEPRTCGLYVCRRVCKCILFKMHERYDRIGFTALLSGSFDRNCGCCDLPAF